MEVLILTLFVLSVTCDEKVNINGTLDQNTNITKCDGTLTDKHNKVITDINTVCGTTPCFTKCCGADELLYFNGKKINCVHFDSLQMILNVTRSILDYSDYNIMDKDIYKKGPVKTHKSLMQDFKFVVNQQIIDKNCGFRPKPKEVEYYLLEDGRFVLLQPNSFDMWLKRNSSHYCLDKIVFKTKQNKVKSVYTHFLKYHNQENTDLENRGIFTGVAMIISAFFLLLVLLVYSVLKQLRNIQGMVLMAYVATLAIGYLFKAVLSFGTRLGPSFNSNMCLKLSPVCYIFLLSSFFWLNIMSFDIWWTFRATRKVRSIHRQGELMKFMWYGLYAWGLPTFLGIIAYCMDAVFDMKSHPYIVTPHFKNCFKDYKETMLYLFTPILIITVVNTFLFFMTIYNIWLLSAEISKYKESIQGANQNNKNRFCMYIKVSALMGVSWILELLNQVSDNSQTWLYILLNTYNTFIGVVIFFMFVFKSSIFKKLCDRFKIENRLTRNKYSTRSTECSRSGKSSSKMKNFETIDLDEIKTEVSKSDLPD